VSDSLSSVHTTPEKIQKRIFLPLGLPSTLIRHENGASGFSKTRFKPEKFENAGFSFSCNVDGKYFENRAFRNRWRHDNHVIFLPEFSQNTNPKWPVIVAFLNSSGVVWTENIWCVFREKAPFLSSSGVVWTWGEAPPYMGYIGMCRCEGYGFQAVYSRIGYINQSVWV